MPVYDPTLWDLPHEPGDLLIRCVPGIDVEHHALVAILNQYGAEVRGMLRGDKVVHIQVDPDKEQELAYLLSATGLLEYVEPNRIGKLTLNPNDPLFTTNAADSTKQWQLAKMGCPTAWDLTTGSTNITVAHMDSGYTNNGDGPTTIHASSHNYVNGNSVLTDQIAAPGHGSITANIIGASTNDATRVAGINWNLTLLVMVIANSSGAINVVNASNAFHDAADLGAQVFSCSFLIGGVNPTMTAATLYALGKGCNISAAGPEVGNSSVGPPYNVPGVIGVTATDINDSLGSNMTLGQSPFVSAPGVQIVTQGSGSGDVGVIGPAGGATSWAQPNNAGGLALMLAANPNLSQAQVRSCIASTCDPGNGQTVFPDTNFGWGRININNAVRVGFALSRPSWQFMA